MVIKYCQYHNREVSKEELESKGCECKQNGQKCRYLQTRNMKPKYRNTRNFRR